VLIIYRERYWELVVFVEEDGVVKDSVISSPIDMDAVKNNINFHGVNNLEYKTSTNVAGLTSAPVDAVFTFYMRSQIKYKDVTAIELKLQGLWTAKGISDFCLLLCTVLELLLLGKFREKQRHSL